MEPVRGGMNIDLELHVEIGGHMSLPSFLPGEVRLSIDFGSGVVMAKENMKETSM